MSPSYNAPRRNPKHPRSRDGIDSPPLPPGDFVSEVMVVTMMRSAQGNCELVADLASHRARLGEAKMVGVGRTSAANQTWMRRDEFEMALVAMPAGLANGEFALFDFGWGGGGMKIRGSRDVVEQWLRHG